MVNERMSERCKKRVEGGNAPKGKPDARVHHPMKIDLYALWPVEFRGQEVVANVVTPHREQKS